MKKKSLKKQISKRLSPLELRVIEEYAGGTRLSSVLARVGLDASDPVKTLAKLCENTQFKNLLDRRKEMAEKEETISESKALREMASIAFFDIADYYDDQGNVKPLSEIPPHARRAIVGVSKKALGAGDNMSIATQFDLADKLSALDKIGRNLKLFTDRVERTEDVTITYRTDDALVARFLELVGKAGIGTGQRRVEAPPGDEKIIDVLPG